MGRLTVLQKYLKNNRIKEYEDVLLKAKQHGYQMISMEKYAKGEYDNSQKVMILRHDVDHVSLGTRAMLDAEKKYGAIASYYFRWKTADYSIIRDIVTEGSEASFHFEVIANLIRLREGEKYSKEYILSCKDLFIDLLKNELDLFRGYYEVPCLTIASHGAEENRKIEVSNNYITDDECVYKKLGIILEAYQKRFIDDMGIYIADTEIEYNEGYRYGKTPQEAMIEELSPILFLSHPNNWKYSPKRQLRKVIKSIIKRPIRNIDSFKRIAK